MLSCSIWFSVPSLWMGGGLESRCVDRDTSIKLPCCIKLAFHIISWRRRTVKQPSRFQYRVQASPTPDPVIYQTKLTTPFHFFKTHYYPTIYGYVVWVVSIFGQFSSPPHGPRAPPIHHPRSDHLHYVLRRLQAMKRFSMWFSQSYRYYLHLRRCILELPDPVLSRARKTFGFTFI